MKIRNGFVSNSSSSSFILQIGDDIKSPQEVCFSMLKDREIDDKQFTDLDFKPRIAKKIIDKIKELEIDENVGYSFNSRNYDTYIYKIGNLIHVNTCNNIPWSVEQKSVRFEEVESRYNREFYQVDLNFIGKKCNYEEECKNSNCSGDSWIINGKKYCMNCDEKSIPKIEKQDYSSFKELKRLDKIED